jgi:hypothetical protein
LGEWTSNRTIDERVQRLTTATDGLPARTNLRIAGDNALESSTTSLDKKSTLIDAAIAERL